MKSESKNIFIIFAILLVLFIIVVIFYSFPKQEKQAELIGNQLVVSDFNYIYNHVTSHICPSSYESFQFDYNNAKIRIIGEYKTSRAEALEQENDGSCKDINEGTIINYFDLSYPYKIPEDCRSYLIKEINNPEHIIMKCERQLKFNILNKDKFNSCNTECDLINGIDIELVR